MSAIAAVLPAQAAPNAPAADPADAGTGADDAARAGFAAALAGILPLAGAPPAGGPPPATDAEPPAMPGSDEPASPEDGGIAASGAALALPALCAAAGDLASRGADPAAAALIAAHPGGRADAVRPSVTHPARERTALDPEFSRRLERVEARMAALGRPISVVETVRSAARQDWLFSQGRTRPGPVVTWTRESRHESGQAADVRVGGPADGRGYALLQQVAREEGLHTIGAKDPGHLELRAVPGERRSVDALAMGAIPATSLGSPESGVTVEQVSVEPAGAAATLKQASGAAIAPVAQVAQVAAVAQVATVAQVAAVAQVAGTIPRTGVAARRPGATTDARPASGVADRVAGRASGATNTAAQRLLQRAAADFRELADGGVSDGESPVARTTAPIGRTTGTNDASDLSAPGRQRVAPFMQRLLARRDGRPTASVAATPSGTPAPADRSGAPISDGALGTPASTDTPWHVAAAAQTRAHVEQVRALHETPLQVVASIAVALDRGDGVTDRVRVGLTGRSLDTSITAGDQRLATLLRTGVPELATALERAGLSADRVSIEHRDRVASPTMEGTAAARTVGHVAGVPRQDAAAFDRPNGSPDRHSAPRDSEDADRESQRRRQQPEGDTDQQGRDRRRFAPSQDEPWTMRTPPR